jgi:hypothetical protein
LVGALTALVLLIPARPAPAQQIEWTIQPYLWLAGLDGRLVLGPVNAPVDASFGDLFSRLEFAALVRAEGMEGDWGLGVDFVYFGLGDDVEIDVPVVGPVQSGYSLDFFQIEGLLIRRLQPPGAGADIIAGARFTSLDPDFDAPEVIDLGLDLDGLSWWDPFIGVRAQSDPTRRVFVQGRVDIGGFGLGSSFAWNNILMLGFRLSRVVSVGAGFRYLSTDYDNGEEGLAFRDWDVDQYGFLVGFDFTF